MSNEKKLKMNTRTFRLILIPIMAIFLIFAIVLTTVTNYFTPSLDAFLGKGSRAATKPSGTSGWDSNYYSFDSKNGEEALANSLAVSESIADEGIVLLKNDGVLPLTADTPVTPLGYRYLNPLMSGSGSGSADTTADYVYSAIKGITEAFSNVNGSSLDAMQAAEAVQIDPVAASGEAGQEIRTETSGI